MPTPPIFAAVLELPVGSAGRRFEHRGGDAAGDFWERYSNESNALIAQAMKATGGNGTAVLAALGVEGNELTHALRARCLFWQRRF